MPTVTGPGRFTFDASTNALLVETSGGGGGATSVNITQILGSAVAIGNPLPVELSDGTNPLGTNSNPIRTSPASGAATQPVSGTVATESEGATGSAVPADAALMGLNVGGTLRGATGVNPTGTVYAQQEDNTSWGGTSLTAATTTTPAGTEAAPVVRSIARKSTSVITTTPLAASATFTSSWFDTNQTGDVFVECSVLSNIAGGGTTTGFRIEGTDDTTNSSFTVILAAFNNGNGGGVAANTLTAICANIPVRFWRVVYVNSATLQTTFELTATGSPVFNPAYVASQDSDSAFYGNQKPAMTQILTAGHLCVASIVIPALNAVTGLGDGAGLTAVLAGANNSGGTLPCGVPGYNMLYNGATYDRQRTPTTFHTASATASGNTAVWTPTSGKKFRLMKFMVMVTGNAAISGGGVVVTISFQDSSTAINIAMDVFVPTTSTATSEIFVSPWVDLANGYLSTAANNVLNVNLTSTLTSGNVRVTVCGTEE